MRYVRYAARGEMRVGVVRGEDIFPTTYRSLLEAIESGVEAAPVGPPIDEHRLLPPIARPGKIFGSGINYASHKEENPDALMPDEPGFFSKFPSSVCGPGDPVRLPARDSQVDYEVELAVVIGKPGRDIAVPDTMGHVFGYTVINDISDRGVQFRPNQMVLGKGFDTFCPMGPVVVTPDDIEDLSQCTVRSFVNGELRQLARVSDMLFDIPTLIAHASQNLTLESGDLITTGTPAGCGAFRSPPLWLQPGDVVDVEVVGVGRLTNPIVGGWDQLA